MDIVIKTAHLAGLYQQKLVWALDNLDEETYSYYFPLTPYPSNNTQLSLKKDQLNSEKAQLQDTYSEFFNLYNEIKSVRQ